MTTIFFCLFAWILAVGFFSLQIKEMERKLAVVEGDLETQSNRIGVMRSHLKNVQLEVSGSCLLSLFFEGSKHAAAR